MEIIAIMGQSGSGKDSIVRSVLNDPSNTYNKITPYTTRPQRDNEQWGKPYFFITREEFETRMKNGEFCETAYFNDWYYGTSKWTLKDKNIGAFSPTAVRQLMKNKDIKLTIYYIDVSDRDRLVRSLTREDNPDIKEIIRRYSTDKEDFSDLSDIPYIVLPNTSKEDYEKAVNTILGKPV